ncbi:MAG: hypothetical protein ACREM6_05555, partial [Vulcanimicrobiaceae bacterium]
MDQDLSSSIKSTYFTILGAALRRAGSDERANEAIALARVHLSSTTDHAVQAEFEYYEGLHAWGARRLVDAEIHARAAFCPGTMTHGRALELLGLIASSRADFSKQVSLLREALAHVSGLPERDIGHEASLLVNLGVLIPELHLPDVFLETARYTNEFPWTDELAAQRFVVLRGLGWCEAIAGNQLGSFRYLREASDTAKSPILRLEALLNRAFLAREVGERAMAADELDCAERLSSQIRWTSTFGEERYALLLLAEVAADADGERASRYLETYRTIERPVDLILVGRADRRVIAAEQQAFGIVAMANGKADEARERLSSAFAIYDSIGYAWRAVYVARRLYELTGEQRYIKYAREQV